MSIWKVTSNTDNKKRSESSLRVYPSYELKATSE